MAIGLIPLREDRSCFSFVPHWGPTALHPSCHVTGVPTILVESMAAFSVPGSPSENVFYPVIPRCPGPEVCQRFLRALTLNASSFSFSFPSHFLMVLPQEAQLEPLGVGRRGRECHWEKLVPGILVCPLPRGDRAGARPSSSRGNHRGTERHLSKCSSQECHPCVPALPDPSGSEVAYL